MISLICIATQASESLSDILIDSIIKRTFFIDEIICVKAHKSTTKKYNKNGIDVIELGISNEVGHHWGTKQPWPIKASEMSAGHQHPFALHCGLKASKNEKVLFSDSDVFFHTNTEAIYLKYLNDGFHFVGVAHHNQQRADGNFPTVINLLTEKKYLPDENYIKNWRTIIDTWLSCPLDDEDRKLIFPFRNKYPYGETLTLLDRDEKRKKILDTGSFLYLWCKEKNMNWLSFLTRDCKHYNSKNIDSSKSHERINPKNILFHLCGGSFDGYSLGKDFNEGRQKMWEENKTSMIEEYKKSERQYNASKDVFIY